MVGEAATGVISLEMVGVAKRERFRSDGAPKSKVGNFSLTRTRLVTGDPRPEATSGSSDSDHPAFHPSTASLGEDVDGGDGADPPVPFHINPLRSG